MCTKHLGLHQGNDSRENKIRFHKSKGYKDPCVYSCHWYIGDLKFKFQLKIWGLKSLSRGVSVPAPLNKALTPVHAIPFIAPLYIKFFIEFPIVSHTT